jgi:hypothetical protein
MFLIKLKIETVVMLVASIAGAGGVLSYRATATEPAQEQGKPEPQQPLARRLASSDVEVQKVLDKYRAARPNAKDLAIFHLDWTPALKDAKERASKEQRPILLIVVDNSYGNIYTGHC